MAVLLTLRFCLRWRPVRLELLPLSPPSTGFPAASWVAMSPRQARARLVALPALKQMALKGVSGWFFFFVCLCFFALANGFSERRQLTPAADARTAWFPFTLFRRSALRITAPFISYILCLFFLFFSNLIQVCYISIARIFLFLGHFPLLRASITIKRFLILPFWTWGQQRTSGPRTAAVSASACTWRLGLPFHRPMSDVGVHWLVALTPMSIVYIYCIIMYYVYLPCKYFVSL